MEDELSTLFKALGHPIRRGILDILKQSPKTTGELKEFFPDVSRYAIMKHLNTLQEGNLVVIRREGKYRLNYLNAIPLQEMYNRWVGKYMKTAATSLLNLKSVTEQKGGHKDMKAIDQARVFRIEQEVLINAPRERVFEALTENVEDWWEFRLAPKGVSSRFTLDPVPGGQFIEKWGEREGAVWGNVYYANAPEEIRLIGHLGMQGAVNSSYTYRLLEKGDKTVLQLSHSASGIIEDHWEESHIEGWKHLLETKLKKYIEENK
ncbi:SRPBCC domain-containing protein [Alkalihalobacillus sp. BA299]|uniref:SRPBCC domain-containing protein n=1 Tax=Alkalihalobacillus sp. BA299 TaxID=2815938 RepID=UPI001ADBE598|nr:SRPBCC domain-containing protein [Alkalihalobacillus sp. BA299]